MKSKFLMGIVILSTVAIASLFADEIPQSNLQEEIMSLKTRDGFEIGLQSYWYKYEEEVDGAFFMSNTGNKYGVSGTGIKTLGDGYYMIADARYATGDVEYSSASGNGDVEDNMYEIRLLVGNEALVEDYLLAFYSGVGYRHLDNDLRDLSGGYRRTSEYLYIPIGVTHRFLLDSKSRISTNIEYDYFVKGEQKSYLSDVGPSYAALYGDPVNKQKHGYGARINTAYEQANWSIGAFFNYWHIGDSEVNYYYDGSDVYYALEPKNDTKEVGVEIKVRF
jgi:hypothetical protein